MINIQWLINIFVHFLTKDINHPPWHTISYSDAGTYLKNGAISRAHCTYVVILLFFSCQASMLTIELWGANKMLSVCSIIGTQLGTEQWHKHWLRGVKWVVNYDNQPVSLASFLHELINMSYCQWVEYSKSQGWVNLGGGRGVTKCSVSWFHCYVCLWWYSILCYVLQRMSVIHRCCRS